MLYLMGLAMAMFTGGMDITTIIIAVGVVIILLTYLGGMEAIIWMDVVQGFLLIFGGVVTIIMLFCLTEGGPATIFSVAAEFDKIDFGPYTLDLVNTTFLVMVLNGIFYAVQKYGTDQSIVQRYLTARDDRSAKKAPTILPGNANGEPKAKALRRQDVQKAADTLYRVPKNTASTTLHKACIG